MVGGGVVPHHALELRRCGVREGEPVTSKRRLFVHIGLPKTGSTTIQVLAYAMRDALARAGIGVPRTGRMARRCRCCHNPLVRQLSGELLGDPGRDLWRALAAELDACPSPTLLISAELFTGGGIFTATPGRDGAARLAGLAADLDLDVRLVAYLRPQWQYAESAYSQLVKMGKLAERFEPWLCGVLRSGRLDYGRALAPWREVFGDRLSVHAVDPSGPQDAVAAHFFGLLGAPGFDAARWRDVRENRRPGAKELEVLRRTGAALIEKGYGFRLRKRLLRRLDGLAPLLEADVPFGPLGAAEALALTERFARANSDLATVYGIEPGSLRFREAALRSRRPGAAEWEGPARAERRRVRRYVLAQTGVDLDRGPDRAASPARAPYAAATAGALRVARARAGLYRARRRASAGGPGG